VLQEGYKIECGDEVIQTMKIWVIVRTLAVTRPYYTEVRSVFSADTLKE